MPICPGQVKRACVLIYSKDYMQKCHMQNKMRRGDWRKYKKEQHCRAQTFPDSVYYSKGCSHWEGYCSSPIQSSRICYQSQYHTNCASSPGSTFIFKQSRRTVDKRHYTMLLLLRFNFLRKFTLSSYDLRSTFLVKHLASLTCLLSMAASPSRQWRKEDTSASNRSKPPHSEETSLCGG